MRRLFWLVILVLCACLVNCSSMGGPGSAGGGTEKVATSSQAVGPPTATDTYLVNGVNCGGPICGNPTYAFSFETGWNGGSFTDGLPAGTLVTSVSVGIYGVACGPGTLGVAIAGTAYPSIPFTSDSCSCGTCGTKTPYTTSLSNPAGVAGFVAGGSNTIQLTDPAGNFAFAKAIITVSYAGTGTDVVSSANPSVVGQAVTFTATVTSYSVPAPAGTVTFFDGATSLGTQPLQGTTATLTTSALAPGAHSITATYNDATHPSTSGVLAQTVNAAATTTGLAASANPSVFGQSVTLTATVAANAPGAGTPGGTVTFYDGANAIGTGALSSGVATLATAALGTGAHTLKAIYGGNTSFATSTSSTLADTVNAASTTTTLVSSGSPATFGNAVTFTATVAPIAPGAGVPAGTVTFSEGATVLGTGALDAGGNATFTTSSLGGGTHAITASYGATAHDAASSSAPLSQVIAVGGLTAAVVTSGTPSVFGGAVTFTATLSGFVAGTPPAGTIAFADGTTALGTGALDASGVATITNSTLGGGTHPITATYAGDTNYGAANASVMQVVGAAPTATALDASATMPSFGQAVTFTATVTSAVAGTITGTVTFAAGTTTIGTGAVDASGKATFSTMTLPVGTQMVTATYGGDANFATSVSSTLSRDVALATTTTALAASANPVDAGGSVTFTATVASSVTGTAPTGSVTFNDGTSVLGTVTLDGTGTAAFSTTSLGAGSHDVTAVYGGDASFATSTSTPVTEVVNAAAADAGAALEGGASTDDGGAISDDSGANAADAGVVLPALDGGAGDAGDKLGGIPTSGGGGCGCRTVDGPSAPLGGPALMALCAAVLVSRRRRATVDRRPSV